MPLLFLFLSNMLLYLLLLRLQLHGLQLYHLLGLTDLQLEGLDLVEVLGEFGGGLLEVLLLAQEVKG